MNDFLKLLENDSRLTSEQLAVMCDKEVGEIKEMIDKFEKEGIILGYKTLIDWDKTARESVTALIELKISPQEDRGFVKSQRKFAIIRKCRAFISCQAVLILLCS